MRADKNNGSVWLATAMSAPLAHFSGGSWLWLLSAGVICGGIARLLPDSTRRGKLRLSLELVLLVILLGQFMRLSAVYWPGKAGGFIVPVSLALLAAWACTKRPERTCGALFWLMVLLLIPVAAAGVRDVKLRWLEPVSMQGNWLLLPVLLLPIGLRGLISGSMNRGYWGILTFGVLLGMLVTGILSPQVAGELFDPLRQMGRSLTLGAASRFESVISVAVTLGWFSLAALLIRAGSNAAAELCPKGKGTVWPVALGGIAVGWIDKKWVGQFAAIMAVILWVILPVLHRKNFPKKREKSA